MVRVDPLAERRAESARPLNLLRVMPAKESEASVGDISSKGSQGSQTDGGGQKGGRRGRQR